MFFRIASAILGNMATRAIFHVVISSGKPTTRIWLREFFCARLSCVVPLFFAPRTVPISSGAYSRSDCNSLEQIPEPPELHYCFSSLPLPVQEIGRSWRHWALPGSRQSQSAQGGDFHDAVVMAKVVAAIACGALPRWCQWLAPNWHISSSGPLASDYVTRPLAAFVTPGGNARLAGIVVPRLIELCLIWVVIGWVWHFSSPVDARDATPRSHGCRRRKV